MNHSDNLHMTPLRLAIIDYNVLMCIGLQQLLSDLLPMTEVMVFNSMAEMERENDYQFAHFFVSSRIYFEHTQFFRDRLRKTIVLVNGAMNINDVYTLNVCQSEKSLVRDIMELRGRGHGHASALARQGGTNTQLLSPRETEVAVLLCKGYINKEIADLLGLGVTTVITHRKNIMEKLHARSLADIIIYCVVNGIINVEDI